jgi:hypothetical protein
MLCSCHPLAYRTDSYLRIGDPEFLRFELVLAQEIAWPPS